jgi:dUTP pyrophosphatase
MSETVVYFTMDTENGCPRMPIKMHPGDAGFDLYVSRPVSIPPGEAVDVHTDVRVSMPRGMYGRITGRSSTMRKYGLLVNEGIIDSGYTGELFVYIRNLGKKTVHVKSGVRLAQILFQYVPDVRLVYTTRESKFERERGTNGFGSTGE